MSFHDTNKYGLLPFTITKCKVILQRCLQSTPNSEEWNECQFSLLELLDDILDNNSEPEKEDRLPYFTKNLYSDLIIPLIKSSFMVGIQYWREDLLEISWLLINRGMSVASVLEMDNMETLSMGVELGFIELAVQELKCRPLRCNGRLVDRAFASVANPAARIEFLHRIIDSGAPLACLELFQMFASSSRIHDDEITRSNLDNALRTLNFIAGYRVHTIQHLPGLLDAIKPYVSLLEEGENDDEYMLGFNATRLIIRVFSVYHDESSCSIRGLKPIIVNFYTKLMRKVMDVGFERNYDLYNRYWKVGGILLDLSLLARWFNDHPITTTEHECETDLLVPLCALVIEMILYHHESDPSVLGYGMSFLYQVLSNQSCLHVLRTEKEQIRKIQNFILNDVGWLENKGMVIHLQDVVLVVGVN
jgi:hypothetical protein